MITVYIPDTVPVVSPVLCPEKGKPASTLSRLKFKQPKIILPLSKKTIQSKQTKSKYVQIAALAHMAFSHDSHKKKKKKGIKSHTTKLASEL